MLFIVWFVLSAVNIYAASAQQNLGSEGLESVFVSSLKRISRATDDWVKAHPRYYSDDLDKYEGVCQSNILLCAIERDNVSSGIAHAYDVMARNGLIINNMNPLLDALEKNNSWAATAFKAGALLQFEKSSVGAAYFSFAGMSFNGATSNQCTLHYNDLWLESSVDTKTVHACHALALFLPNCVERMLASFGVRDKRQKCQLSKPEPHPVTLEEHMLLDMLFSLNRVRRSREVTSLPLDKLLHRRIEWVLFLFGAHKFKPRNGCD